MHQSLRNPDRTFSPPLRAVPMGLFPTMGSLQEVVDMAESSLPVNNKNAITTLLMTYHNTMLKVLIEQTLRDN